MRMRILILGPVRLVLPPEIVFEYFAQLFGRVLAGRMEKRGSTHIMRLPEHSVVQELAIGGYDSRRK